MQLPASQQDVVLAWSLQSALSGGLAVACGGLAVTFRRPAMRILAVYWTLMMVASVFIWGALAGQSMGWPAATGPIFGALAFPLTPVLAFILLRHLVQLLSGATERAFPPATLMASAAVGGFLLLFALQRATAAAATQGTAPVTSIVSSAATIIGYVALAIIAWRAYRLATVHRAAIRLLGASFALLAVRSTTNFVVAGISARRGEMPEFGMGITTVQISLLVIAGVLQLIAVLDEERASIVLRAEQLRLAEATVARSQRLESLGRMAGGVAHDFNNVLTVIISGVQSAMQAGGGDAREELHEIETSAKRGHDLTKQLLAFARQAPERIARFDANGQLDGLRGMLKRIVGSHAALEVTGSNEPLFVDMDATQFDQIAMNLVTNARDATPAGGAITVRLAAAPDSRGGTLAGDAGLVRLTVRDTGAGIADDVLPHIFEPFYTTKQIGEGTGLGLATCDGIVRRLGGRIDVKSEAGKGTQFDVLIPRAPAP